MSALRHAVITALERAREAVARGRPSLRVALWYQRLDDRASAEVDRAVDAIRFEPGREPLDVVPKRQPGESRETLELRDAMEMARRNAGMAWEDPEGLTRMQCVGLLSRALERVRRLPVNSQGPMFDSLPFTAS